MVTAKSGFTWRPERPKAPTFVEQKARFLGTCQGRSWPAVGLAQCTCRRPCRQGTSLRCPRRPLRCCRRAWLPAVGLDGAGAGELGGAGAGHAGRRQEREGGQGRQEGQGQHLALLPAQLRGGLPHSDEPAGLPATSACQCASISCSPFGKPPAPHRTTPRRIAPHPSRPRPRTMHPRARSTWAWPAWSAAAAASASPPR